MPYWLFDATINEKRGHRFEEEQRAVFGKVWIDVHFSMGLCLWTLPDLVAISYRSSFCNLFFMQSCRVTVSFGLLLSCEVCASQPQYTSSAMLTLMVLNIFLNH